MASKLTHLRAVVAAILLIAGSGIAISAPGPIQRALGISVESGLANADISRPVGDASEGVGFIPAAGPTRHHGDCLQDCSTKCVTSAVACCAVAISLAGHYNILDEVSIAACAIRDGGFLPAGIEPESLLHPPQEFA